MQRAICCVMNWPSFINTFLSLCLEDMGASRFTLWIYIRFGRKILGPIEKQTVECECDPKLRARSYDPHKATLEESLRSFPFYEQLQTLQPIPVWFFSWSWFFLLQQQFSSINLNTIDAPHYYTTVQSIAYDI
jgi:hypothetical protein